MEHVSKLILKESDRVARDLRALVDDAEALLQHAVKDAGSGYSDARSRLEKRVASTRAQLADIEEKAVEGVKQAGRAADGYVHENPWPVIGASAGFGLLLGLLIGRK